MSFAAIHDHETPLRLLRNMLRHGRIPNGLLCWGPEGVGKKMAAIAFAKALQCRDDAARTRMDACDACLSCGKIDRGNHPDVKVIIPSGKARLISVETIEYINDMSAYRPYEGAWRVFIIDDAHRIGEPAQNHFLKTLEEPPSNTVFILCTPSPRQLLPTIRSRCQQLRFGALQPETVARLLLANHDLPAETAQALAALSQGQMARALDLVHSEKRNAVLHAVSRLGAGEDALALSEEFTGHIRQRQEAIRSALKEESGSEADMSKEEAEAIKQEQTALLEAMLRKDMMEYLYLFQTWYRDELVVQAAGPDARILNRDYVDQMRPQRASADRIEAIEKAWRYIERNLSMDRVFRDLFFALSA